MFDGIETVVENVRLARRLSGHDMKPMSLPLLSADDESIVELSKQLQKESYDQFIAQPLHRYSFFIYLKHSEDPPSHEKLTFMERTDKFPNVPAQFRLQEAREIFDIFFESKPPQVQHSQSRKNSQRLLHPHHLSLMDDKEEMHEEKSKSSMHSDAPQPLIVLPKPLLKQLDKVLSKDEPIPVTVFDDAREQMRLQLKNHYYPRFLESEEFTKYVLHREYANRGHVTADDFSEFRIVGRGAFGAVAAVCKNDTGALYARKEMSKRHIKAEECFHIVRNERNILAELSSPYTIKLWYAYQTEESIFFLMDYCSGGDLKWHLRNNGVKDNHNKKRHFEEDWARFYCAETLIALEHLHSLSIVYRDLKPANLLINSVGHVQLSDFGLAEKLTNHKGEKLRSTGGTPGHWGPEVLMKVPYGIETDVWGLGVLLYCFLSGGIPECTCNDSQWCTFDHRDEKQQETRAMNEQLSSYNGRVDFPEYFSSDAIDLLRKIFVADQAARITTTQIKAHPFFRSINFEKILEMKAPIVPGSSEVCADSLAEVGELDVHKYRKTDLDEKDQKQFADLEFYSEKMVQEELTDALVSQYERFGLHPTEVETEEAPSSCCVVL